METERETRRGSLEIRLHGRGGQGTVTMAALLVDAAFRDGWHALGFPAFGTERTGAPVTAFVRLSDEPIRDRSQIRTPRIVVVQDPTLAAAVDLTEGLEPGGTVLVNAEIVPPRLRDLAGVTVIAVPVTALATEHLGSPITSTAMLGLLAGATGLVRIESVCAAVRDRFSGSIGEKNEALVRAAHTLALGRKAA
ncbi:MAG TPA: 2-oxoacid:acceptor oxidoreductase family protein [Actinomycetota bacterium]|nr:2-oxoacid:acceptor oxidoreductase family protein [Actinomycetota bacterium]